MVEGVLRVGLPIAALALCSAYADARVQEYQIVRLLSYKTSCRLEKLEDRSLPTGPMRFLAHCENVSFYPDGIEIVCPDRDDDRSCTALAHARSFDQLRLLAQPR